MSSDRDGAATALSNVTLTEVAMFTEDVPAATTFYEALFGDPLYADDAIAQFDVNGVTVLLHETTVEDYDADAGDGTSPPNEDHFAVAVPDLDAAFDVLAASGLEPYAEPDTYEWGRSAYFTDPDGRFVEVAEK